MRRSDVSKSRISAVHTLPPWAEVLAEAEAAIPGVVDVCDLLTPEEIQVVLGHHAGIGKELEWVSSLDRYDWALSIAAGVLAGIVDIVLVQIPAHPGFLGAQSSHGGWLSNIVKQRFGKILPPDKINALERAYPVSYDPSTSTGLGKGVQGLGPGTHRFQSLGHDPLLGFIFGIRDILKGEFTAIDKYGKLIVQTVGDPHRHGEALIVRLLDALRLFVGHLASDAATSRGLPAPLMPLLSFLQFGKIGQNKYTIGEVARQMYRSGYDLRHFAATTIPVLMTELIIRVGFFVRSTNSGKTLREAIPTASIPKLRRQLLLAHSCAMLINAGKVYVTKNPLSISWAQALAVLRYLIPEIGFLLYGAENTRARLVQAEILHGYEDIIADVDRTIASMQPFNIAL